MKILQLHTRYLEPGGEDGVVAQQGSLLRQGGHQVDSLEFQNPTSSLNQLAGLAVASWNLPAAKRTRETLSEVRPDVVHVHNTWYSASPSALREVHRAAPTVMTIHNYRFSCLNAYLYREGQVCNDCVGKVPWRGVARRCYRGSALASTGIALASLTRNVGNLWNRYVDQFLVLSDFAGEVLEAGGIQANLIRRMDNFVPDPGPRQTVPSVSGRVLAVGRMSPEKGFVDLVKAWKQNPPTGLILTVVGDGDERSVLEAMNVPGVEIVGRKNSDEIRQLMLNSRALLFPSQWYEGQPLVLLEALAAGLPIVSSDHPPLREVLEPAGQVLVTNGEWASSLDQLADGAALDAASEVGRSSYEKRFSADVAWTALNASYESVKRS